MRRSDQAGHFVALHMVTTSRELAAHTKQFFVRHSNN